MIEKISDIIDEIHVKISSIQVRLSKLEQYARLQDDLNRCSIHYLPTKPNASNLSFDQAIKSYIRGKKIRRKEWLEYHQLDPNTELTNLLVLTNHDVMKNDWEIVS